MDSASVRDAITTILRQEARWEGPLPEGGLDQHFDSLQRLSLVVAIEDHFRICLDPEDEQRIHSVDDLIASVVDKVEASR